MGVSDVVCRREYGTFRLYSGDDGTSNQLALALWYTAFDLISAFRLLSVACHGYTEAWP